jgi:hypothetical protein
MFDLSLDPLDGGRAFFAAVHQDDAFDNIVVAVLAGDSESGQVADLNPGDVADENRAAVWRRDHGAADLVRRVDDAHAPHDGRLRADVQGLGADIAVAVVQRGEHLVQRQPIGLKLSAIDQNVVCFGLAAPPRDIDHAGHGLEPALQHPVLQRFQVSDGITGRSHHAIAIDFPDRTFRR